jgi:hypothetical protein
MTSDNSDYAHFKKITGDKNLSTFRAMDKEEVEGEVLEAAKEGKLKVEHKVEVVVEKPAPVEKKPEPENGISIALAASVARESLSTTLPKARSRTLAFPARKSKCRILRTSLPSRSSTQSSC